MSEWGKAAYWVYRAATRAATPAACVFLYWRHVRGLEHPTRWPERLGRASARRPNSPLLWFHAVSLGEGLAAIPVIKHCINQAPQFSILLTTTTVSAFEVIKDKLPDGVIYQFSPIDTPNAMDNFLAYWKPSAVFLMESELWPNLVVSASEKGIPLVLLNARISPKSFTRWSSPVASSLISLMLSKFTLIASLSTVEAIRFQLLQAPPSIINFQPDLKYAVGDFDLSEKESRNIEDLKRQINNRPTWIAASIHKGEEEVMLWVHNKLVEMYPDIVMILVMRHPQHGHQIAQELKKQGLDVALRSRNEIISPSTSFYVADTLGELRTLYRITPIAVIGGSFLPKLAGHNISEAAAAGCAVITGPHMGHFSRMITEMRRSDPLSVVQVGDKVELLETLKHLLDNPEELELRRIAAKHTFSAVSSGVVQKVWQLIETNI